MIYQTAALLCSGLSDVRAAVGVGHFLLSLPTPSHCLIGAPTRASPTLTLLCSRPTKHCYDRFHAANMALSVDQKRLKATKFPPEFDQKVDIEKVNIDLMKKWIANKITTILGDEDDVVVETCFNLVEQNQFVSTDFPYVATFADLHSRTSRKSRSSSRDS
jgi:hypothetical protein